MSLMCRRFRVGLAFALLALLVAPATAVTGASPPLDLSVHRGKVVLLDFWASWCAPCAASFPWMETMRQRYGAEGLVIVSVNLDEDRAAAEAFLGGGYAGFEHVFDPSGSIATEFGVAAMPTALIFDREGRLVARHEGFTPSEAKMYEQRIAAVLAGRDVGPAPAIERTALSGLKPWQRGVLASRDMSLECDALDMSLDDHIYFSKEASTGGRGFGGGGCGCN